MKQISIIVESVPGVLADITELMAISSINIDDIEAETIGKMGILVMTVDKYDLALRVLRDSGYHAISEESILVKLKDEPGALAKIAKIFGDANINIRGIHIVNRDGCNSFVAISTERTEEAIELVRDIIVF
ncbi:MAG: ACT domain-containing protein [Spirochaetota bacterium]|nr:ACT domain-containing protein [Spirochaetota bacterium]